MSRWRSRCRKPPSRPRWREPKLSVALATGPPASALADPCWVISSASQPAPVRDRSSRKWTRALLWCPSFLAASPATCRASATAARSSAALAHRSAAAAWHAAASPVIVLVPARAPAARIRAARRSRARRADRPAWPAMPSRQRARSATAHGRPRPLGVAVSGQPAARGTPFMASADVCQKVPQNTLDKVWHMLHIGYIFRHRRGCDGPATEFPSQIGRAAQARDSIRGTTSASSVSSCH